MTHVQKHLKPFFLLIVRARFLCTPFRAHLNQRSHGFDKLFPVFTSNVALMGMM